MAHGFGLLTPQHISPVFPPLQTPPPPTPFSLIPSTVKPHPSLRFFLSFLFFPSLFNPLPYGETRLYKQQSTREDHPTRRVSAASAHLGLVHSCMRVNQARQKRRKRPMECRSRRPMLSPVQNLYETCREVFADGKAGYVPPPKDIERLKSVLDDLTPENVGLTADMQYFRAPGFGGVPPPVTYIHIFQSEKFSIGIFCLPPAGVLPLHNHPGMTVFNKLLLGSVHIKSYDWVADQNTSYGDSSALLPHEPRLAKVHADSHLTAPCKSSVLYPNSGGNMHCFTALTPCAMLDVLGPPYSDDRHCKYYNDFPYARFPGGMRSSPAEEKEEYGWLTEVEQPESFVVVGAMYSGPQIVED